MMNEDHEYDYESLGANSTMTQNAIAGALAGIGEHCLMFPVDSIKTRIQVGQSLGSMAVSSIDWFRSQHLWRGVYSVVMGAGPAHALHFATYEFCKVRFYRLIQQHGSWTKDENLQQLIATSSAGACATLAHDGMMTPFDVIKQRMQLKDSVYRSVRECARQVYAKEGITAFYISLPTTLSMSIPFQSIQFSTYERCLSLLNPGGIYDPKSHVVAGAVAGIIASSVTTPLDVIKTLLQTRGSSMDPRIRHCSGFWEAGKLIYEHYGYRGFFRGFKPRILTHMPATAISWSVYEYFKWFLSRNN
ncbi:mitochondrial carrier domain-containing protein [Halteromyces radiatus]|uniref:mitochondrial carrier domain-containing protein n=1 Tax=Halteromyces radiatus TaxID=101107 RepID=UPI00221F90E1|nr:mitochondrial carrier domain-containing protein [Halteromyces radiatus]KAI8093454.1 mitochondrial carrier domain-containing protein [Halteromyces radiatus]